MRCLASAQKKDADRICEKNRSTQSERRMRQSWLQRVATDAICVSRTARQLPTAEREKRHHEDIEEGNHSCQALPHQTSRNSHHSGKQAASRSAFKARRSPGPCRWPPPARSSPWPRSGRFARMAMAMQSRAEQGERGMEMMRESLSQLDFEGSKTGGLGK
jgi:hypothetical protein